MSTETPTTARHELEEVIANLAKGKRDPQAMRKAAVDMDTLREEIRKRHGLLDIAVPYIRELRALAEQEGCELVTADQRLITNLGSQFPIVSLDAL